MTILTLFLQVDPHEVSLEQFLLNLFTQTTFGKQHEKMIVILLSE